MLRIAKNSVYGDARACVGNAVAIGGCEEYPKFIPSRKCSALPRTLDPPTPGKKGEQL